MNKAKTGEFVLDAKKINQAVDLACRISFQTRDLGTHARIGEQQERLLADAVLDLVDHVIQSSRAHRGSLNKQEQEIVDHLMDEWDGVFYHERTP